LFRSSSGKFCFFDFLLHSPDDCPFSGLFPSETVGIFIRHASLLNFGFCRLFPSATNLSRPHSYFTLISLCFSPICWATARIWW
jgi:hypothetical protein